MTNDDILLDDIRRLDQEMEQLIGRKVFGYISRPTPTTYRITFADQHVALSMTEAHAYMTSLVVTARHDTRNLPWPLSEPIEPSARPR